MNLFRQVLQQARTLAATRSRASSRHRGPLVACAAALLLWPAADNRPARDHAAPYVAWHARGVAEAPQQTDIAAGRRLLEAYQCGACHRIEGVSGAQGTHGPALLQWGRRSYIAGRVPNTPKLLTAWIVNPSRLVPGTAMPDMGVTQRGAQQMAAYLLRPE